MESSYSVGGTITFLALFQHIYTIAIVENSLLRFYLQWNFFDQL